MKINKNELDMVIWYEDEEGNMFDEDWGKIVDPKFSRHSCFPLAIVETVYFPKYEPRTKIGRALWVFSTPKRIFHWIHPEKYNTSWAFEKHFNIGSGVEKIIMEMVNSGDYTLSQAVRLLATCCERCTYVVAHKYTNGEEGYPEFSEEWKDCGTICRYCKEEEQ